jgi:hypothetical protein
MTTFLPLFVVLRKFGQVSIFVDVVQKTSTLALAARWVFAE